MIAISLFLLGVICCVSGQQGLGTMLVRSAGAQRSLPITKTDALEAGWTAMGHACTKGLGWPMVLGGGDSKTDPITLYYTSVGQLSSLSVRIYGAVSQVAVSKGFIQPISGGGGMVTLRFRDTDPCAMYNSSPMPIGDAVRIASLTIPNTASAAANASFTRGACISGMGRHYPRDMVTAPKMSWLAQNLFPLVPMYDATTGNLNAVFVASPTRQQSLFPPNDDSWDVIPITNGLMCKNFCDSKCTFTDQKDSLWSTMHLWFQDPESIKCPPSAC